MIDFFNAFSTSRAVTLNDADVVQGDAAETVSKLCGEDNLEWWVVMHRDLRLRPLSLNGVLPAPLGPRVSLLTTDVCTQDSWCRAAVDVVPERQAVVLVAGEHQLRAEQ